MERFDLIIKHTRYIDKDPSYEGSIFIASKIRQKLYVIYVVVCRIFNFPFFAIVL